MKTIFSFLFIIVTFNTFSQNNYVNPDGTLTNYAKRQILIESFKNNQTDNVQYEAEDDYFVIITKYDCGNKEYDSNEMQEKAMVHCFGQLLNTISSLKKSGYGLFTDVNFQGIIFKTNTICMYKTRRYHFKFTFDELKRLPEYLDFDELFDYVVVKNQNKNIIYIKNEK